jgi:tetratricopeptide (TPR) repeat protein
LPSSLFIGLARSVGLQAYYADASVRVHETRHGDGGLTVNSGPIAAIVESGNEVLSLDFARLGRIRWYRVIDDLEALAHYYNNRGFDLIEEARDRSIPVNWGAAAGEFRMATRVSPGFARAWSNLGIASAHLGDVEGAIRSCEISIARDPSLAATYNNLGSLYLSIGDSAAALAVLEHAEALEPRGAHIQYNLARAKALQGDRGGAMEALRRAIELRGIYSEAQASLEHLASQDSASSKGPRGGN